jgi:hypothetical protein
MFKCVEVRCFGWSVNPALQEAEIIGSRFENNPDKKLLQTYPLPHCPQKKKKSREHSGILMKSQLLQRHREEDFGLRQV